MNQLHKLLRDEARMSRVAELAAEHQMKQRLIYQMHIHYLQGRKPNKGCTQAGCSALASGDYCARHMIEKLGQLTGQKGKVQALANKLKGVGSLEKELME